jgi:hypothetical protein
VAGLRTFHTSRARHCRQSLLNERQSRSAGDVTDEERISTCGVSGGGNVSVRHEAQAMQPVRNRSWAQTSSIATASKRYRELVLHAARRDCTFSAFFLMFFFFAFFLTVINFRGPYNEKITGTK